MWWIVLRDTESEDTVDVLDVNIPVLVPSCVSDGVDVTCVVVVVGSCEWCVVSQGVLVMW